MKKALTLLITIILIMYGIPGTAEISSSRILIVCFSRAGSQRFSDLPPYRHSRTPPPICKILFDFSVFFKLDLL